MNWPIWVQAILVLSLSFAPQISSTLAGGSPENIRGLEVRPVPGSDRKVGFTLMNPRNTGVGFTNVLQGDAFLTNAVAHNGSGVALGDIDGDGWVDLYFCGLQSSNHLYRNLGNWRFQEIPAGKAACAGQFSTGATFADVDGDGDLDLLVNGIGTGTRLFLNDGKGGLNEALDSGLSRTASATSLALGDIDGDGDLDLYCTHYIDVMHLADPTMRFAIMIRNGRWIVAKVNDQPTTLPRWKDRFEALPGGKIRELPEVHGLYRNDGHGHFTAIQFEPGVFLNEQGSPIPPYRDWGLSVMFRDLNGDGAPDIYVCNDNASPDRIWMNTGRGAFRALPAVNQRHTSRSSMALDIADVNRDGRDDVLALDMLARDPSRRLTQIVRDIPEPAERDSGEAQPRYNRNMLFLKRADGSYAEVALMAGVAATDWSWCPIFIDVDLDGYEDLLVSNGFNFDVMDQDSADQIKTRRMSRDTLQRSRQMHPAFPTKNAAFHNRHDGTFEPADSAWGFDEAGVSNGMALADFDNDGDLDVVINNMNGVASLYRNDATAPRFGVRLKGRSPNTAGIGARVEVVGPKLTQSQEMICGGRYMSGDQAMRVFAADPNPATGTRLEVTWRNGDRTIITNPLPNRVYEIDQTSTARPVAPEHPPKAKPVFTDVSTWLGHNHVDEAFDDWARQPLLPRRLSRLGPGVCWYDVNGDNWDDLIISGGRGGKLAVYTNQQGAGFKLGGESPPCTSDQGALVGWPDGRGNRMLLAARSNYEGPPDSESAIQAYSLTNQAISDTWPAGLASLGPMALADVDGDGDLDLFLGGRFRPGRYPEPVASSIWINDNGRLRLSQEWSRPFQSVGLVSGATFADLDGDGLPDLALAIEWGPVRVFRNAQGHFQDTTDAWGFSDKSGWWTSIVAGDFDNDGKLDLAVGNWGRNSIYELYRPINLSLFYGEWTGRGALDLIEAWQDGKDWRPIRDRRALTLALPDIAARFPTYAAFGKATVQELLGERLAQTPSVRATHLDSTVFLNRGSRFDAVPLPNEAQLTPVFGLSVADYDGDGIEDLFVAQNFFGTASDLTREDSGLGLWLHGTGEGHFQATDAIVSGIKALGEQRGTALADFNHDGRIDLAVTQNNGPTKLYVNETARRGLRVVPQGPAANPQSIGAQLRVMFSNGQKGPCRLIQAGSGYWSQDSAIQVLGLPQPATGLWLRWPGGKEQTISLKEGEWESHPGFEK